MAEILPIDNGRQQSSFRRFKIVIPANGSYKLDNPFNYFRCYNATSDFKIMWSANNSQTDFGAGLGVKFDEVLPYVIIRNPSENELTVDVGVGIGYFDDSRLSVSGTIYVANNTETPVYTTELIYTPETPQAITTVAAGTQVMPSENVKKALIQNVGSTNLRVYAANGLIMPPMATLEITVADPFSIFGNGSIVYQEWI